MGFEAEWELYTSSEKETFQRVCRRLLKSTFIVKEKEAGIPAARAIVDELTAKYPLK